jgi:two-component system, NtrC family, sensor kinase
MDSYDNEHIEIEPFDREYTIEELLHLDVLTGLSRGSAAMLPGKWVMFTDTGHCHHASGNWLPGVFETIEAVIKHRHPDHETAIDHGDENTTLLFPVEYELEIKGYLGIHASTEDKPQCRRLGRAMMNLLKQLMRLSHRTMLTSGLHGLVVEESYTELKDKAEQLARSEEKYRKLSESLEIEVQKKTEEIRLAHAQMMQQEKMAAIGQLSAGMAHEINNPLGFILSNLSSLKSYGDDLAKLMSGYRVLSDLCRDQVAEDDNTAIASQTRIIQEVEQALDGEFLLSDIPVLVDESVTGARRIKKIVKDLKAVARPGETRQELINIHESIDAVLTIVDNRFQGGVTVAKSYGPVPLVSGFPQEISQIWLNLIVNALDAIGDDGTLEVTTKTDKGDVRVSFRDSGPGIPPEHLGKIFDPFFTTKEVGQGTGLGLHLVYNLAAKHGGQVAVHSEVGQGSCFSVQLPAAKG